MALLRFEQLSFAYPNMCIRALDGIDFSMTEGEYVVLCGTSGCGKTTLLRQSKRELWPAGARAGVALYCDRPLADLDPFRSATEIGFVQQNPENQIVTDFVWHELAFGLENMALPTSVIRRRVAEMAAFFGMEPWFRKKTCELSGGQKQMLNLASVMVMDPKLLILDEPTSMLDPLAAQNLLDTIEQINRELGVAILMTEHRLEQVFPAADRVVVMERGRIVADDTPQRVAAAAGGGGEESPLFWGLPTPVRVFSALGESPTPLTIRDGRRRLGQLLGPPVPAVAQRPAPQRVQQQKAVLSAREVWFHYGQEGQDILRGIDFELFEGELTCLLGGNGAGKTTLLQILAGILKPQRGKVTAGKQTLAMLPQSPQALFTQDQLEAELLLSADGDRAAAERWAGRLGLSELLERHPYDLSGGELQRAAMAKLLLAGGTVLLMDEPTKGLDAYHKKLLADILRGLTQEGTSILVVTHDLEFAADYAQRCAMMFDGVILSSDEPHAFFAGNRHYTTPANRMAGAYFPQAITCQEVVEACRTARGVAQP